jgi:hypothetical protein
MNGFDDFDTTITAEEFYSDEVDSLESWESVDTTDEPDFDGDGEPHGSYDLSDIGRDRFTYIAWEIFPASMLHRTESAALVVFPYSEA